METKCTKLKTREGWRSPTEQEIAIILKIMMAKITAHSAYYCFCDEKDNLYNLDIQHYEDMIYVIPMYIRSKVKSIQNSKPAGYYEALDETMKPLVEIFHHIPLGG